MASLFVESDRIEAKRAELLQRWGCSLAMLLPCAVRAAVVLRFYLFLRFVT